MHLKTPRVESQRVCLVPKVMESKAIYEAFTGRADTENTLD